jgi:hypothetical protein
MGQGRGDPALSVSLYICTHNLQLYIMYIIGCFFFRGNA